MNLQNAFERQGNWLFRWRSYLPIAFLPFLILAVRDMHWPFGNPIVHEVLEFVCLAISFIGLFVRILAVGHAPAGTSGRNTKIQIAKSLNTTGMYSLLRHPLYLGNYLIGLGVVMVPAVWWLPVFYSLSFLLYYERIMFAEEVFLKHRFGEEYCAWAEVTPAFIPNLRLWRAASLPFSFVTICRREYTALALIVLLHFGIEVAEHIVIERRIALEPIWIALICSALGAYVILRTLKKQTCVLDVAGR